MKLHEPATFWTDCALALWSAGLGGALARHAPSPCPETLGWWIGGFATSALAAAAGAVHHGLGHTLPPSANRLCWHLALLSLVATGLCLIQVAATTALIGTVLVLAKFAAWIIAALFAYATLRTGRFSTAIWAYGLGQLLVLAAAIYARDAHSPHHFVWLAAAVATSALAAIGQHQRIGLSLCFNHNDLYHVIQFVAQGLFYLGAATWR